MGIRPLRQYYERDGDVPPEIVIDPAFAIALAPWHSHRTRFDASLRGLATADWERPTRCDAWNVRSVIGHLVVVDGFWALTLGQSRAGAAPATMLEGFDPAGSTDDLVAATLATPVADLMEQFTAAGAATAGIFDALSAQDWQRRCESPLGHLPTTCILGHMMWDSWLHERDIFVPMGTDPGHDAAELLAVTWFALCFAGLQGGLLGDPRPVGPGPDAAIDCTLAFTDLPDVALRVRIGEGIAITAAEPAAATPAGSAVALVDGFAGRTPVDGLRDTLPADLFAQLARASQTLN